MIDPSDRLLDNFLQGNAQTEPTPTGGEDGQVPYTDYHDVPGYEAPIFKVFHATLAPGASTVFPLRDRCDYWHVSVRGSVAASLGLARFYSEVIPAGDYVELSPNGILQAAMPQVSKQGIYVENAGTVDTIVVQAMACRGYPFARLG